MKRLLFVDDEPELTEVVREYLHDSYDVVIANSGASALASVRRMRPDVVFLDISMPRPSGIEVLKELRRSDPTLPVIMVTVNTDVGGPGLPAGRRFRLRSQTFRPAIRRAHGSTRHPDTPRRPNRLDGAARVTASPARLV